MTIKAFRASLLHCLKDPGDTPDPDAVQYFDDGMLVVEDGIVRTVGPAAHIAPQLGDDIEVMDYRGHLLLPGFIDCHIHYPQTDVIASFGTQLLDWLNTYTFPSEARFSDRALADEAAAFFIEELLRNGTTTALVFATVHPESVDALFSAAARHRLRIGAGKVLMDRNSPENLRDTAATGTAESRQLIERWHGQDRFLYAITPRFACTSTPEQLLQAGELAREYPDVFIHSHVAENLDEVAWVAELFPDAKSYLDVYDRAGLVRERAVFAHGIYLDDNDRRTLAQAGAALAFCPTSNLFLGSGLFDLAATRAHGVRVGLATDVGGGTSFSQFATARAAYNVLQMQQQSLSAYRALYLATLAGAEALHLEDKIGNFLPGKEADFIVVDLHSTRLLQRRMEAAHSLPEMLFAQWILADERAIAATYILGECAYDASVATL